MADDSACPRSVEESYGKSKQAGRESAVKERRALNEPINNRYGKIAETKPPLKFLPLPSYPPRMRLLPLRTVRYPRDKY